MLTAMLARGMQLAGLSGLGEAWLSRWALVLLRCCLCLIRTCHSLSCSSLWGLLHWGAPTQLGLQEGEGGNGMKKEGKKTCLFFHHGLKPIQATNFHSIHNTKIYITG